MQSVGAKLISSLIIEGELSDYLQMGLSKELFLGIEDDLFTFVDDHVQAHGVFPHADTIEEQIDVELPTVTEPATYYLEHFENRYFQQRLKKIMLEAQGSLKKKQPKAALELLQDEVVNLTLKRNRQKMVNYTTEAYKLIKDNYMQQWLGEDGIHVGWPYLDRLTGGLLGGDVLVIVGRPGTGKTYNLLHMAMHPWLQGKVPLVVSMEMNPLALSQRIAAMQANVPANYIKTGDIPPKFKDKVFNVLSENAEDEGKPPFWIVDGNLTASVNDIALLCHQLKPDCVYVDGAYMLKSESGFAKHEQIADSIQGLKEKIAGTLDIPVVASYQFNREQTKAAEKGKTGVQHIGGSDAIGQIASVVLGVSGENDPSLPSFHDHVKIIEVLKGRNGETGSFKINWKFSTWPYMDFSELNTEKYHDKDDKAGHAEMDFGDEEELPQMEENVEDLQY